MDGRVLWTAEGASLATGGCVRGGGWSATGVSIDSRTIKRGDLFIALRGLRNDGHGFVRSALDSGAVGVCVMRDWVEGLGEGLGDGLGGGDVVGLVVEDTFEALCNLGRFRRRESGGYFFAVTGSVGKTGTKEMLVHVLRDQGFVYGSEGNLNNCYGVPLSLARVPSCCDYVVLELGMSMSGEMEWLTKQVEPDVVVITTIEAVHLEFFESVGGIADAKAEIFRGMGGRSGSTAILNRDNVYFERLLRHARSCGVREILSFGRTEGTMARLLSCEVGCGVTRIVAEVMGRRYEYCLGMLGEHWAMNSLGVLLGVYAVGGDVGMACEVLGTRGALAGRGKQYELEVGGGRAVLIDESYNASPRSVVAALRVLATMEGRRIVVLGDMRELGEYSVEYHRDLLDEVLVAGVECVFCCGTDMRHLYDVLPERMRAGFCATSTLLAEKVVCAVQSGDILLVKGSLYSGMKTVVSALLQQFTSYE